MKELTTIGIRPIFFPPKGHDLIEPLLELLASKTPKHRSRNPAVRRHPIYHNLPAPLGDILSRDAELDSIQQDTIDEQWERLEGLHRRVLGEIEIRWEPPDFKKARYQLERAACLITETDTRTHAQIELSLARAERGLQNHDQAVAYARAARAYFDKLRMRKESEEADVLLQV